MTPSSRASGDDRGPRPTANSLGFTSLQGESHGAKAGGFRLFLPPPAEYLASGFGFLEASKRWTMEPRLEAWRIFAGAMIAY